MRIACVSKASASKVLPKDPSWKNFCSILSKVTVGEKDGLAVIPANIPVGPRKNSRVLDVTALFLDVEEQSAKPPPLKKLKKLLKKLGWACHVHTSYSHTPDKPRYRVIVKLHEPIQPQDLKRAIQWVARKLKLTDCYDKHCTDPARLYYLPRCPAGNEHLFESFTLDGEGLRFDEISGSEPSGSYEAEDLNEDEWVKQIPKSIFGHIEETPKNVDLMESRLAVLDPSCGREQWRNYVWAILSLEWKCAKELARDWSKGSKEKWDSDEFCRVVESYDATLAPPIDVIFAAAKDAGWERPEPEKVISDIAGRFNFLTTSQLSQLPATRWRVKNLLPAQGLASIYGPSGSGKSFLALDLLAKVSMGQEWYGMKSDSCPVVYVALEGVGGIRNRLAAYEKHYSVSLPENFRVVTDKLSLFNSDAQTFAEEVNLAELSGGVIVIDTLAQSAPQADENASADMGRIVSNAQALQRLTGSLVILIHHTGKDATRGARGHSSLHAALDAAIEVRRPKEGREWLISKSKDGEDGLKNDFRLLPITLGFDEDGDLITSCVAVSDAARQSAPKPPAGKNQKLVLAALKVKFCSGAVVSETEVLKVAVGALNCLNAKVRGKEALNRLEELGYLHRQGNDFKFI